MRLWPQRRTKFTMSNASGTFVPSVPPKRIAFAGDPMPSAEAVAEFCAVVAETGVTSAHFAETVQRNAIAMFGLGETSTTAARVG